MFERDDWKLFRNIDTLCQKAGVSRNKIPALIVKELVDNALDVSNCELELLPYSENGFSVRDYGKGLDELLLNSLFCINRPMITSKLLRLPTRGALGNGLRVVAGAIISTNGQLFVETKGNKYEILFLEDGSTNIKFIDKSDITIGTKFNVILGNTIYNMSNDDLVWGNNAILMATGESHSCKTSPYWYTSEAFFELINAYKGKLEDFLLLFHGINKLKLKIFNFENLNTLTSNISFNQSEIILSFLRENSSMINIKKLGCVGENNDGNSYIGEYSKKIGEFNIESAKGIHNAIIPFLSESWIRIQDKNAIGIYVNKTPITGEFSQWYDKGKINIYGLGLNLNIKIKPSQICINVMTPYMPITSDGKAPNFNYMNHIIQDCLRSCKNKAKKVYTLNNEFKSNKERDIIMNYMNNAIDKASGHGNYKFSQRQLYYAIRPYVMNALDKQPEYNYFCRLLTEFENIYGEIENLYRDPRGTLYHPHLKQEIPLGTIAVQNYERPEWTFNKILYCEKEGFFPILMDAKFPERYDCALLSSKGYASRAVKDLFDLLGETDEEILFFCIHDSDAAGTMIYETLQDATLSRSARKVKVIDLGLNPWEAINMGLEIEKFESKCRKPVAKYIQDYDDEHLYDNCEKYNYTEWLQTNRVELNAMSTPQFLEWIENKIKQYDNGKVIPNTYVLGDNLMSHVKSLIKEEVKNRILRQAGYNHLVEQEINNKRDLIDLKFTNLKHEVIQSLENNSEQHWTDPIKEIAKKIVE